MHLKSSSYKEEEEGGTLESTPVKFCRIETFSGENKLSLVQLMPET